MMIDDDGDDDGPGLAGTGMLSSGFYWS